MIDMSQQMGYPEGPAGSETPANQPNPPADGTSEEVQVGQDHIDPGSGVLSEPMPTNPLDLSTVAVSMQESVDHFDAVGLATAFTDRIEQAAMSAGYCEMEPQGMEYAGPEPD